MIYRMTRIVVFACILVGCGKVNPRPAQLEGDPEEWTTKLSRSILKYADPATRRTDQRKKYILIAGGRDAPNFALEVIEQKRLLKSLGVADSEVSCFYTIPFDTVFRKNEARYRQLAPELSACYPAYPKHIWDQIQDAGKNEDSLYLYITSHGGRPLSKELGNMDLPAKSRTIIERWLKKLPGLDQFVITADALADGEPGDFSDHVDLVESKAASLEDAFFTPRHLREAIRSATSEKAKKFIVVQGCYSGGFLDSDEPRFAADSLKQLKNITVVTASRFDRSSFGCDPGSVRTYFGGAFNDALQKRKVRPQDMDWKDLYREITERVTQLESAYTAEHSGKVTPSEPMFFSNP